MTIDRDRDVVRRLAGEIAEIAESPAEAEKVAAWQALNDLKPVRPMLWITEIPFGEFESSVEDLQCVCENETLRRLERRFRHRLFTARRLDTDEVVSREFGVSKAISGGDYGVPVEEHTIRQGDSYIQSHSYEGAIKGPEDIEKIRMPEVVHDEEETARRIDVHERLFGDILDVKAYGVRQGFFNGWDCVVQWTGVTEALMDMMLRPEYIHALMRRLTDAACARHQQQQALGLLDTSNSLPRIGSGAAGYTSELPQPDATPGHLRTQDLWGGATAQIFGDVSPEMHQEFALDYEIEVMAPFGLNYYGCCEPLHNKMHLMAKVPNLRKISISPWCDVAKAAENATQPYVFSHKPNPAIMAGDAFDAGRARDEMQQRLDESGDMPCEFIMKDISTCRGDAQRVIDWCRIARETINTHA